MDTKDKAKIDISWTFLYYVSRLRLQDPYPFCAVAVMEKLPCDDPELCTILLFTDDAVMHELKLKAVSLLNGSRQPADDGTEVVHEFDDPALSGYRLVIVGDGVIPGGSLESVMGDCVAYVNKHYGSPPVAA